MVLLYINTRRLSSMNKQVRQLELLLELLNEREQIEENIKALPVGYISVKQISGHTYPV